MAKPFYITTTLPYVNADPHVGFALEIVQSDVIARFKRLQGIEVFFSTGADEHGQKIFEAAQKNNQNTKDYVDHYAAEFRKLKEALNLSNDTFIRTSSPEHIAAAQEMWKRCDAAGDIYKKKYQGLYCVGCERFLSERDMVDGKCSIHGKEPVMLEEENYFFRFSKYQEKLLEYLSREDSIIPDWRRQEAINFVKNGLEDFSISREKEKLSWGIPVPGDENQVMYVWFDALTNYVSTLGWPSESGNFDKFWNNGFVMQTAGKDQVRFQSLMWQAMLFSAGIKNTDTVFYHGFINSGGVKMSKSLGNVINPLDIVNEYGTDALRYYILRHIHSVEDSDMTMEKFKEAYNANLANGLGNLVSRIMKLAESYLDERTDWDNHGYKFMGYLSEVLDQFRSDLAMEYIWSKIADLDRVIQEKKPWESKDKEVIKNMVLDLYRIGKMLEPFLPETSRKIIEATKSNIKPENLFARKD
jgi:methionyl-tRNA synthetase